MEIRNGTYFCDQSYKDSLGKKEESLKLLKVSLRRDFYTLQTKEDLTDLQGNFRASAFVNFLTFPSTDSVRKNTEIDIGQDTYIYKKVKDKGRELIATFEEYGDRSSLQKIKVIVKAKKDDFFSVKYIRKIPGFNPFQGDNPRRTVTKLNCRGLDYLIE